jgi:HlyD family secretion protein
MKRRLIILGGLTIIVAAAVLTKGFGLLPDEDRRALTLYGNVDIRAVDLGFRVSGRIAEMPVEEGARVAAGAVLARLDTRPLADSLNLAEAQVRSAAAELEKRRNGNRPQDIAQAVAVVAERRAALAQAREDYERRARLVQTGAVSRAAFDAAQATHDAAQAQLEAAEQALSLQREGTRPEDIEAAAAQHAVAIAQRDRAQTDLADATILAPDAGTILTRAREPGAVVLAGETVFTLTIERPLRVRAYVAEPDLSRIAPGMAVLVQSDGNPRRYAGTIGFIAPTAEFTPKTVQTESLRADLVYRLRIIIPDADDALRQGQPVTINVPDARPAAGR